MADSTWDPKQYERFKREREYPFLDLLKLIQPQKNMTVLDLGCGTGENTRTLHETLAAKTTLGIDSSDTMLAKSQAFEGNGLTFQRASIEEFHPVSPVSLVFSNAAVHFVQGHEALFPRLAEFVAPGGQIAIHLPSNHEYHTHVVAALVAGEEPFKSALGSERYETGVLQPEDYARLFYTLGFDEQIVRVNIYTHLLPTREEVYQWVKGSLLTWYEKRLSKELFPLYIERYREELFARLPDEMPFFFTFRRLLLWAKKPKE
jgi:trans-aconitate 2-methyltransferase